MEIDTPRPRVAALTLGCKVNQYDSEAVLETFAANGFEIVSPEEEADVYLINTCTVTNIADKKSRQLVRRVVREHPEAVVAAFGCYAQTQAVQLEEIEGLSIIAGTQKRAELVELVSQALEKKQGVAATSIVEPLQKPPFEELTVSDFGQKVRAVLKIQEGCQQFCSYCKVPYARGPERSREVASVLAVAKRLVEAGYKEIVLTGIHLASYGRDLTTASSLVEVAKQIADISGLHRLRLSSVEPTDVSDELLKLMANHPVVCRHLHMPLQSGSTSVLARMRRKYTAAEYLEIVERAREIIPAVALTTDIIVGFPGETDEEFAQTMETVRKAAFSRLHVFPYSRRAGTPAAKMPEQIPTKVKNLRSQELTKLGDELALLYHQRLIGSEVEVLFEESMEGFAQGYTETYIRVKGQLPPKQPDPVWPVGEIGKVLVRDVTAHGAVGDIVG